MRKSVNTKINRLFLLLDINKGFSRKYLPVSENTSTLSLQIVDHFDTFVHFCAGDVVRQHIMNGTGELCEITVVYATSF